MPQRANSGTKSFTPVVETGDFMSITDQKVHSSHHHSSGGNSSSMNSMKKLRVIGGPNKPTLVEKNPLRIVITDAPSDFTIEQHVSELLRFKVKHVARACEPTYSTSALSTAGIKVHDLAFPDGDPPSEAVINTWLELIDNCFVKRGPDYLASDERISVHCVAGLGRAPVLVAI